MIIFDLDGTLIDTWHLYIESYRRTLEPYLKKTISEEEIINLKPTAERRIIKQLIYKKHWEDAFSEFINHYRSLHDKLFEGPYPGVLFTLNVLRKKGLQMGIVTGKSRKAWEITQSKAGLGCFNIVITDCDVEKSKPNPEGILKALESINLPKDKAIYIGDSTSDLETANAAGLDFAAALWPKGRDETEDFIKKIKKLKGRIILETPYDLIERLNIDHSEHK